jgi:hypothetical protein
MREAWTDDVELKLAPAHNTKKQTVKLNGQISHRLSVELERVHILTWRGAERPPVLPAELGRALVPDSNRCMGCVEPLAQHQPPGLVEAQSLLVLERTYRRDALEVEVKRRRAHSHMLRERIDPERVREVVIQPADRSRDALGRGTGRDDLAQPRPCGPVSTR